MRMRRGRDLKRVPHGDHLVRPLLQCPQPFPHDTSNPIVRLPLACPGWNGGTHLHEIPRTVMFSTSDCKRYGPLLCMCLRQREYQMP